MRRVLMAAVVVTLAGAGAHADAKRWWSFVESLANDGMEGRDTGSAGHKRAAEFVAAEFKKAGLEPAGVNGYIQPVKFKSRRILEEKSSLTLAPSSGGAAKPEPLTLGEDATISMRVDPAPSLEAPLVFVGYGLNIPERNINDFAGLNLKGAMVVYVNATPKSLPGPLQAHFGSAAERWLMYRAAGAVGTISIANPKTMDIPWARSTLARLHPAKALADPSLGDGAGQQLSITLNPAHADKLFAGSGHTFKELLALVDAGQPVPAFALPWRLKATTAVERTDVESQNVAGILRGSDATRRNEYVAVSAHLDGYGIGEPVNGDRIYNGAFDDAAYVATLIDLAETLKASGRRFKRSILFCVFTAEERGLLGSQYFVAHPTVAKAQIVADINLDTLRPIFPLRSLTTLALDRSSLGEAARQAGAAMGIEIRADAEPDRQLVQRSDQWNFLQAGIPAIAFVFGYDAGSRDEAVYRQWYARRYHSPSDDLDQPWDPSAAARFNAFFARLLETVAEAPARPVLAPPAAK